MEYPPSNCWPVGGNVPRSPAELAAFEPVDVKPVEIQPIEAQPAGAGRLAVFGEQATALLAALGGIEPGSPLRFDSLTATELLEHLADTHARWAAAVRTWRPPASTGAAASASASAPPTASGSDTAAVPPPTGPMAATGAEAVSRHAAAVRAARDATTDVVAALAADADVNAAGAGLSPAWIERRLLHHVVLHRADVAAATGTAFDIAPALALDGITEFVEVFGAYESDNGTVHLHCTGTGTGTERAGTASAPAPTADGEWTIDPRRARADAVTRIHGKADVAVRGTAADVWLTLWGRSSAAETFGATDVLAAFSAAARPCGELHHRVA